MPYDFLEDFEGIDEQDLNVYDALYVISTLTGSLKIDTAQHFHLNASCRITSPAIFDGLNTAIHVLTSRTIGYCYYSVRMDTDDNPVLHSFALFNAALTACGVLIVFYTDAGGNKTIKYYTGGSGQDSGLRFAKDTWYTIKIEFNCAANTYSAYIIGGLFLSWTAIVFGAGFYQVAADIANFRIAAFNNGSGGVPFNTWFDGIAYGPTDLGYPYFPGILMSSSYKHWML